MTGEGLSLAQLVLACLPYDSGELSGRRSLTTPSRIAELLAASPALSGDGPSWREVESVLRIMRSELRCEYVRYGTRSGSARRRGLIGWRLMFRGADENGYRDVHGRVILLEAEVAFLQEVRRHGRRGCPAPALSDWAWIIPLDERLRLRGFIEDHVDGHVRVVPEGARALELNERRLSEPEPETT